MFFRNQIKHHFPLLHDFIFANLHLIQNRAEFVIYKKTSHSRIQNSTISKSKSINIFPHIRTKTIEFNFPRMDRIKESNLAACSNSGRWRRSRVSEPYWVTRRRTGESKEYEMVEIGSIEAMDGNMKWSKWEMGLIFLMGYVRHSPLGWIYTNVQFLKFAPILKVVQI